METRANYVWVGVITLVLLAALAAFIVWLAQLGTSDRKHYDIFFQQSVGGLANGSQVSFSGVPVGQVSQIELWDKDPEYVRVRVRVQQDVPILVGTTASVQASFTGVSTINLDGARRGAPPITCETTACPEGVPVIPPRPGGLGEILASAPLLLERLATLTERLTRALSDENQQALTGILANTEQITAGLAQATPELEATMVELRGTLEQATQTLDTFDRTLASTDRLLNEEGTSLADDLRATLASSREAAAAVRRAMEASEPAARELTQSTLPAAEATLRELTRTSEALRQVAERVESEGAGSLVRGTRLPDYEP